jgi:ketosteroid isomerase-like protein
MNNLQTTQQIYEAFGRGDVPAILEKLAETVDWEYGAGETDVPWLQRRRGRDGAAAFFASLGAIDIQRFELTNLLEGGPTVVGLVNIEFVVKATGKRVVEEDEAHIWHFDEQGRVVRFRHRVDTQKHALACKGS